MAPTIDLLLAVLLAGLLAQASALAWLWARVTAMPTHQDLEGLRRDVQTMSGKVERLDATAEQTLESVRVIQSYLMERER